VVLRWRGGRQEDARGGGWMTRPHMTGSTPPLAYDQEVMSDFWDDDGTDEWSAAWEHATQSGGCVLLQPDAKL
jgi:hypothetical protein